MLLRRFAFCCSIAVAAFVLLPGCSPTAGTSRIVPEVPAASQVSPQDVGSFPVPQYRKVTDIGSFPVGKHAPLPMPTPTP